MSRQRWRVLVRIEREGYVCHRWLTRCGQTVHGRRNAALFKDLNYARFLCSLFGYGWELAQPIYLEKKYWGRIDTQFYGSNQIQDYKYKP